MKATGIVRRIDDLGRVVIPKEIRRTLRIREGDPLEIFTDREGEIILKKYSPIGELGTFAKQYAESLAQVSGLMVCITDRDAVIAAAGGAKKDYMGKAVSQELEDIIQERENIQAAAGDRKYVRLVEEELEDCFAETRSGGTVQPGPESENGRGGAETGSGRSQFSRTADGAMRKKHHGSRICSKILFRGVFFRAGVLGSEITVPGN